MRREYFEEFLTLLTEKPHPADATGWPASPAERIVGCLVVPECEYGTTGSRGARTVLVLDARLPDYPAEELDLLEPK